MTALNTPRGNVASDMTIWGEKLIRLGFKVLPLMQGKANPARSDNRLLMAHGVRDATDNFATFKRLTAGTSRFNIGIATGSASGVIVIDVDPRNGGDRQLKKLQKPLGPLPRTLTCDTGGGGQHYYFIAPTAMSKKKGLAPALTLLADGCYAVAPPSRDTRNRKFLWAEDRGPWQQKVAPLPETWLAFIKNDDRTPRATLHTNFDNVIRPIQWHAGFKTRARELESIEAFFALIIEIADQNRAETDVALANDDLESLKKIVDDSETCFVVYPDPADEYGLGFTLLPIEDRGMRSHNGFVYINSIAAIHCRSRLEAFALDEMVGEPLVFQPHHSPKKGR
jgi:hypothetical protein